MIAQKLLNAIEGPFNQASIKIGFVVSLDASEAGDYVIVTPYKPEDADFDSRGIITAAFGGTNLVSYPLMTALLEEIKQTTGFSARLG